MIDLKNRIIYIHIPKCAGTSIEKYFMDCRGLKFENRSALGIFVNNINSDMERANSHSSLSDIENFYFGGVIPEDFRVFTVVRDPYKRFWSEWSYRRIPNPKRYGFGFYLPVSLMTYLAKNPISRLKDFQSHIRPQSSFLNGMSSSRVRVLRLENLTQDFNDMKFDWGLPDIPLPKENKSSRRRSPSDRERKIGDSFVRDFYAEDFKVFGYDM